MIVRAFTTPLAVPTSTVFDPSICPKYLHCSNRESKGPKRRLDGCEGIHHTRSPNCAEGEPRASPHSFRMLSCRLDPPKNRRCMLVAYDTSQVNRSWCADTSTPEADSTDSLIDLTCPLTTSTEHSAAPLDCGSPSADVSCTTTPVQANFDALSNARMAGSAWKVDSFRGNQMSKNRLGHSIVHHQDRTVSTLFYLSFTDSIPGSKETVIPRRDWDLRTIFKFLAAFSLVSVGSTSLLDTSCTP